MMISIATDSSDLMKEFNRIYLKRVIANGDTEKASCDGIDNNGSNSRKDVASKKSPHYKSNVKGLYRLVHLKNSDTIRLIRRSGSPNNNDMNKPNSVCITDEMKSEFLSDNSGRYIKVELNKDNNKNLYKKWLNIINKLYKDGLKEENKK